MARLYTNENFPRQVVEGLRALGHDVLTVAEARCEKSVRHGHISPLHLWWTRRPLVACRAAGFGALVPTKTVDERFVHELCTYPGPRERSKDTQKLILQAHAERLTVERGEKVTVEDAAPPAQTRQVLQNGTVSETGLH